MKSANNNTVNIKMGLRFVAILLLPLISFWLALPAQANVGMKNLRAGIPFQSCDRCAGVITRQGLQMNGGTIEGNVQQLTADFIHINNGSTIKGDLLVPGNPEVVNNSNTVDSNNLVTLGCSSDLFNKYKVLLTGKVTFTGQIVTQYPTTSFAPLAPVALPTGTRNVVLSTVAEAEAFNNDLNSSLNLRSLVVNSKAGAVKIAPGSYERLTANSGSQLVLGNASNQRDNPAVYNLQDLVLNSDSDLVVVGYVQLRIQRLLVVGAGATAGVKVAGGVTEDANLTVDPGVDALTINTTTSQDITQLRIDGVGSIILNSQGVLCGVINAPNRTITVNSQSKLIGNIKCDRLVVHGDGMVKAVCP
jgi:cytoskeletal protein CcmA (bactofilin family)